MNDRARRWFEVSNMPTVIVADARSASHESLLRSYHVLQQVKQMLADGVPADYVLTIIAIMEKEGMEAT